MINGQLESIIDICNKLCGSEFRNFIDENLSEIDDTVEGLKETIEVELEELDKLHDELLEDIQDTKDTINVLEEQRTAYQQEQAALIAEKNEVESEENAAKAAILITTRLPIIIARLSVLQGKIAVLDAQILDVKKDLLKLEAIKVRQDAYEDKCKRHSHKYIADAEHAGKRAKRDLLDCYERIIRKAGKCRDCIEKINNLVKLTTDSQIQFSGRVVMSVEDIQNEMKNIAITGGNLDTLNKTLKIKCDADFQKHDIIHEKIHEDVNSNLSDLNRVLRDLSYTYENLSKIMHVLEEYDSI